MSFGLSGAALGGLVAGAGAIGGALISGSAARDAASSAADAQTAASQAGISEQQRQFNLIDSYLAPYRTGGANAFGQQQTLAGLNGNDAQQQAINALMQSPAFTSAQQLGEMGILQNASATGGLRGGNTQAALAQFRPALLASTINDQYARLGGLSSMGLGAAGNTGQFGQSATNNVTNLLQQQGAAGAGAALAAGRSGVGFGNLVGQLGGLAGSYFYRPMGADYGGGYSNGAYTPGADPLGGFIAARGF